MWAYFLPVKGPGISTMVWVSYEKKATADKNLSE